MFKSYIHQRYYVIFIIVLLFLYSSARLEFFLLLILGSAIHFLFRKNIPRPPTDETKENVLSPVNGSIVKIDREASHPVLGSNLTRIEIAIPWWAEGGIFMPLSAKIDEVTTKRAGKETSLILKDEKEIDKKTIALQVGVVIFTPEIPVMSGDRALATANIGHIIGSGIANIFLGSNYNIFVQNNDEIFAGETILGEYES